MKNKKIDNKKNTFFISIVLPLHNEEGNLQILYQSISKVMKNFSDNYELIFIDDGSTDDSFNILKKIQQKDKKLKLIQFRTNFGKTAAYRAGFHYAKGEIILTMDTDLQDDPNDIPYFINKINEGYDMVVGWRHKRKDSLGKTLSSKIFNRVVSYATRIHLHDFNCPFKAYRKEVLKEINIHGELHRFIPVLAVSKGFSFSEIKINNLARLYGKSKYGKERFFRGMMDLLTVIFITRFEKRPLHFLGITGVVACMIGFCILLFLVSAHFFHVFGMLTNPSWNFHDRPALSLGILMFIVGTQCFSIGLLGELLINQNSFSESNKGYSIKQILDD